MFYSWLVYTKFGLDIFKWARLLNLQVTAVVQKSREMCDELKHVTDPKAIAINKNSTKWCCHSKILSKLHKRSGNINNTR